MSDTNDKSIATTATASAGKAAEYWVSRNGEPVSGPYTIDELRHLVSGRMGETLQYLGKVLITDLAKADAMEEWVTVDRVLAAAPGDNTTDHWVSRNGQMSGPYTIASVADWAKNGRIRYTDQVKNIAMPEWLTVERALSQAGFSVPPPPPAHPARRPASVSTPAAYSPQPQQKGMFAKLVDTFKSRE